MLSPRRAPILVLPALFLAACGEGATVDLGCDSCSTARRDAGAAPDASVGPPTGRATLDRREYDFGTVELGLQQTLAIRVRGDLTAPSQYRVVAIRGTPDPDEVRTLGFELGDPIVIPAGRARSIDLSFRPRALARYAIDVEVELCAGGCKEHLALIGTGAESELACEPELNIGAASLGSCVGSVLRCANRSLEAIEIADVVVEPGDQAFSTPVPRLIAPPLGETLVELSFCPAERRAYEATLQLFVRRRDGELAIRHIPLRGEGVPDSSGCRLDEPSPVDFGEVTLGASVSRTVVIRNIGSGDCALSQLPLANTEAFTLHGLPPVIALGEAAQIELSFHPPRPSFYQHAWSTSVLGGGSRTELSILAVGFARARPSAGYAVSRSSAPLTLSPSLSPITLDNGDDGAAQLELPFPFELDGVPTTSMWITSNGWVSFLPLRQVLPRNREPYPSAAGPNGLIALWWDDLFPVMPGALGAIEAGVTGRAPERVFHVRYRRVPFFSGNPLQNLDAELRLFETGAIELHYGSLADASTPSAAIAGSVGWESLDGATGATLLDCSPRCGPSDWPTDTVLRLDPR